MLTNQNRIKKFGRNTSLLIMFIGSLGLFLASCSDNSTSAAGGNNGGGNGGNEIGMEPTFENVQAILSQSCGGSSCHIGSRTSGVRLDSYQNITESVGEQYRELIVQPDDPGGSPLVDKLQPSPQYGSQMPQGGAALASDRVEQIRTWISNGAPNN